MVASILDGAYKNRTDAVKKCYNAATKLGYKYFAVHDGGECLSSETAQFTYNKYGTCTFMFNYVKVSCCRNYKGGYLAITFYIIRTGKSKVSQVIN